MIERALRAQARSFVGDVVLLGMAVAAFLLLLALLATFGFDLSVVGILPADRLDDPLAVVVATGWVLLALGAGGVSFVHRDVT